MYNSYNKQCMIMLDDLLVNNVIYTKFDAKVKVGNSLLLYYAIFWLIFS